MKKSDFIFLMMRSALWKTPTDHYDMTPWEYKEVITYAEKQCVLGLVVDCLKSNNIGLQKKCVIHMLKLQNSLEIENRNLNANVAQLSSLLDKHQIDYLVVKGQTLSLLYPKPLLRVPGDIDFYVNDNIIQDAKQIIEKEWEMTIPPPPLDEPNNYPFVYNNNHFEMHFRLVAFSYPPSQRYFQRLIDTMPRQLVTVNGVQVRTLAPTLNLCYTFVHMYHHLKKMGVALRQLCDVALIINHFKDSIDKQFLGQMLDKIGYRNAFISFGSIIVDKLGLPEEEFPFPIGTRHRKWGRIILDDILLHGNWGKYEREDRGEKRSIGHSLGTARLLVSRYFRYFMLTPKENFAFLVLTIPQYFLLTMKKIYFEHFKQ